MIMGVGLMMIIIMMKTSSSPRHLIPGGLTSH